MIGMGAKGNGRAATVVFTHRSPFACRLRACVVFESGGAQTVPAEMVDNGDARIMGVPASVSPFSTRRT